MKKKVLMSLSALALAASLVFANGTFTEAANGVATAGTATTATATKGEATKGDATKGDATKGDSDKDDNNKPGHIVEPGQGGNIPTGGNNTVSSSTSAATTGKTAPTTDAKTTDEVTAAAVSTIKSAKAGETVTVPVPAGLKVSRSVFEEAKKAGVQLVIKTADGKTSWKFKNLNTMTDSFTEFDPTATVGVEIKAISDLLNKAKLPAGIKYITVDFAYSGVLPGEAEVTLDLSAAGFAQNAKVYLYYYNPQTKLFELASTGTYKDGSATFTMTHCSQYVVTDKVLPSSIVDSKASTTKAPKTGDNNATALYLVLCGMGVAAAGVAAKRKKNA